VFVKIAILDDWFDTLRGLNCFSKLDGLDVTVFTDHCPDVDSLAVRLEGFDAVVLFRERSSIPRALIEKLPHLKLISQRSVYPHIDIEACTDHGVLVCSNMHSDTPSFAAAEHTWALILAAMRDLPNQMQSLRAGQWQMGVGKSLHGRRLGLYGYGRIGKQVAQYGEAFGMDVVWWASEEGRDRAAADGLQVAKTREIFFGESDIVSIHVRLKPETKGIITAEDFSAMGEAALFVNTSRAGLIVEGALLEALEHGRPGQAALDVFDSEPVTRADDPLINHPRMVATPHIGFVTVDEFEIQFADIFDQIVAYIDGKPIHMINPSVLPQA
jgi:D-3-phosphoglycerate dehydrogenase